MPDTDKQETAATELKDEQLHGVSGAGVLGRIGKVFGGLGRIALGGGRSGGSGGGGKGSSSSAD